MKLLLVNYEYPPLGGGGGVVMAQQARCLVERGHQAQVLTSHYRGLAKAETVDGVNILRVPVLFRHRKDVASQISMYSFFPSGIRVARRHFDASNFDLIHTHFAIPSGPTGINLARKWNLPHVLTVHGGDIYDPSKKLSPHRSKLMGQVVRKVLAKTDCVTTYFTDIGERTRTLYGYQGPLELIPYGLPPKEKIQPNREKLGFSEEEVIFISVARLIPRKNFPCLLDSLAGLKKLPWRWICIGSGPELEPLKKQVNHLGLKGKVEFKGNIEEQEKDLLLASSDVFVLPSLHEGFGVVNLEAMFHGLAVVTTRVGGQVDFLEQDRNALLVQPDDTKSLTEALERMIKDSSLRLKLQENNLQDIQEYQLEKMVDRFENLFETLIERKKQ